MRSPVALAVLALVTACTRTETVVAEVTPSTPSSAKPAPVTETPPEPAPAPITIARSADDAPQLGSACTSPSLCGTRNRFALRAYDDRRFAGVREPAPCTRIDLSNEPMGPQVKSACVEGDRFFFQASCVMCRMPSASIIEATVSETTPAQRDFIQKVTGLEVASLTAAAEWSRAIRDASRAKPKN